MISGQGSGMDDMVQGMMGDEQPVAVSPGEFIVPADVVSGLGEGSSDAGAKKLDEMMDRVRMERNGTTKQAPQIDEKENDACMNISLVPPEHAHSAWNDVRHYLEPAVETANGRWTMEHLCAAVCMGSTQLWVAFDEEKIWGCLTTEVTQYQPKRCCLCIFLAAKTLILGTNFCLSRSPDIAWTWGVTASRA